VNSGASSGASFDPYGDRRPAPLERGRAAGMLAGLVCFTAGLAAAALLVLGGYGSTPGYYVAITFGLVGIGLIGFFYHRGAAALPPGRIWSPAVLRAVVTSLDLPAIPILAVLYVLGGIGVVGNLVVPLLRS
jgi:hypothetical protein